MSGGTPRRGGPREAKSTIYWPVSSANSRPCCLWSARLRTLRGVPLLLSLTLPHTATPSWRRTLGVKSLVVGVDMLRNGATDTRTVRGPASTPCEIPCALIPHPWVPYPRLSPVTQIQSLKRSIATSSWTETGNSCTHLSGIVVKTSCVPRAVPCCGGLVTSCAFLRTST